MKVALIGAGPIGIEAAAALKRNEISYIHFEANDIAHTIRKFPDDMIFYSAPEELQIPAHPLHTAHPRVCTRDEYLFYLNGIILKYDLTIQTGERVISINQQKNFFAVQTQKLEKKFTYFVDKIIIATGGMSTPRLIQIPGESLPHVSHFLTSPATYSNKRLTIVGGGNSAVEAAILCYHAGADITLSYRRDKLNDERIKPWLLKEFYSLEWTGKITALFNTTPIKIDQHSIRFRDTTDDKSFSIPTDYVLLMTGYTADMTLCREVGVFLSPENEEPAFNPETMETNVPGIYLAGTVTGGTQSDFKVFINTSHENVERIISSLLASRCNA
ncbi:NAD(P)-binding domain-containing protein [bacterium]|nr:NAD(P)-binding domain-containing protein [bacterium]MCP5462168.1 NAD(P)-binding domain-containing protein [bacterium]